MKKLAGEADSVDMNSVKNRRLRLQKILSEYPPKDRFNYDETSSFYKLQPGTTRNHFRHIRTIIIWKKAIERTFNKCQAKITEIFYFNKF